MVPSVASSAGGLNNVMGTTNLLTPVSAGNVTTPGGHLYSSASPFLNSANLAMGIEHLQNIIYNKMLIFNII